MIFKLIFRYFYVSVLELRRLSRLPYTLMSQNINPLPYMLPVFKFFALLGSVFIIPFIVCWGSIDFWGQCSCVSLYLIFFIIGYRYSFWSSFIVYRKCLINRFYFLVFIFFFWLFLLIYFFFSFFYVRFIFKSLFTLICSHYAFISFIFVTLYLSARFFRLNTIFFTKIFIVFLTCGTLLLFSGYSVSIKYIYLFFIFTLVSVCCNWTFSNFYTQYLRTTVEKSRTLSYWDTTPFAVYRSMPLQRSRLLINKKLYGPNFLISAPRVFVNYVFLLLFYLNLFDWFTGGTSSSVFYEVACLLTLFIYCIFSFFDGNVRMHIFYLVFWFFWFFWFFLVNEGSFCFLLFNIPIAIFFLNLMWQFIGVDDFIQNRTPSWSNNMFHIRNKKQHTGWREVPDRDGILAISRALLPLRGRTFFSHNWVRMTLFMKVRRWFMLVVPSMGFGELLFSSIFAARHWDLRQHFWADLSSTWRGGSYIVRDFLQPLALGMLAYLSDINVVTFLIFYSPFIYRLFLPTVIARVRGLGHWSTRKLENSDSLSLLYGKQRRNHRSMPRRRRGGVNKRIRK